MAGNNIGVYSILFIVFFISFFAAVSSGRRPETSYAGASWITLMVSVLCMAIFNVSAYITILPAIMVLTSTIILFGTKD